MSFCLYCSCEKNGWTGIERRCCGFLFASLTYALPYPSLYGFFFFFEEGSASSLSSTACKQTKSGSGVHLAAVRVSLLCLSAVFFCVFTVAMTGTNIALNELVADKGGTWHFDLMAPTDAVKQKRRSG